jgi:YggT family protein
MGVTSWPMGFDENAAGFKRDVAAAWTCTGGLSGLGHVQAQRTGRHSMITILKILQLLLDVAFFIMLVHIVMSWLINFNVLNLRQPLVAQIWDGLNRLLEPIYTPIRRMLPNTGALDLAPLVLFIIIIILRDIVIPDLARAVLI